jgi:hypothetical protein
MLQKVCVDRGHILTLSHRGHCELAGRGVEYSWGKSKHDFRRNNDCIGKHLLANIKKSVGPDTLPVSRMGMFAHKARDYKRAFDTAEIQTDTSHALIEAIVKKSKAHRCCLDTHYRFCIED